MCLCRIRGVIRRLYGRWCPSHCESEVDYAVALHKRLIPVLREPVANAAVPEEIRVRNWVPFTADASAPEASTRLVAALDTDLQHVRGHTHWLVKATEWEAKQRDRSVLLRGSQLAAAEAWLARAGVRQDPAPTMLQKAFVAESRRASSRRQRLVVSSSVVIAGVSVVLLVFALISRSQAVSAQRRVTSEASAARSRLWASEAIAQLPVDPERSILIAMAAVRESRTSDALFALRRALDVSPVRARLPGVGRQTVYWGPGISYSPDGTEIAEGSADGYVTIFDAADGRLLRRFRVAMEAPIVQYNPAGTRLAVSTGSDGLGHEVVIVDPLTGTTLLRTRPAAGDPADLVFSRDGSILYFASGGTVVRWDLRTDRARMLASPAHGGVGIGLGLWSVALSPDGRRLAVAGSAGVALLNSSSGRVLAIRHSGWEWWIGFSPNGRQLGVAEAAPLPSFTTAGSLLLLNARTLRPVRTLLRLDGDAPTAFAFTPDGTRMAFGTNEGQAGVYDLRSGNELVSFPGHTTNIWQVAFSPDGREVTTAAGDGSTSIWSATGAETESISTGGLNPDLNGWSVADLTFLADRVVARFSPISGSGSGDEVVRSWSSTGRPLGDPSVVGRGTRSYSRISANGRDALSGEFDRAGVLSRITIRDTETRRTLATIPLPDAQSVDGVQSVQFSPDGSWIAYALFQGLRVRQVMTGRLLKFSNVSSGCPYAYFNFGSDDRLVVATDICGDVVVVNTRTDKLVGHVLHFVGYLTLGPAVFNGSGTMLAVANSANPGQVAIVNLATDETIAALTGDTKGIETLAFSPDGSLIATASLDGTARIWNAHTGQELRILDHPDGVIDAAFNPDGSQLATLDYAGVIRIFRTCPDCTNSQALLALARTRITRRLTAAERRTFLG